MGTEIVVDKNTLQSAKADMEKLSEKLINRKLSITFNKSKGDTVDEFIELAKQLNSLQSSLSVLFCNTEKIMSMLAKFEKNDKKIAEYFEQMEISKK